MPTLTFLLAMFFASFSSNTATAPVKNDHTTGKTTTTGKPNNGDFIIGVDIHP